MNKVEGGGEIKTLLFTSIEYDNFIICDCEGKLQ